VFLQKDLIEINRIPGYGDKPILRECFDRYSAAQKKSAEAQETGLFESNTILGFKQAWISILFVMGMLKIRMLS
jgi:hypothetical protein